MKKFDYTCRNTDGRLTRGTVQAADRSAAVRQVKTAGGVPLSVTETARQQTGSCRHPRLAVMSVITFLLLAVITGILLFSPKDRSTCPVPSSVSLPPQGAGSSPSSTKLSAKEESPPLAASETGSVSIGITASRQAAGTASPVLDSDGIAVAAPLPIRGGQRRLAEAIARGERISPLFSRVSEGILALYSEPGRSVIGHPLPDNFEDDMREALAEDIVVTDSDTPEEERAKELVAWLKEDMRRHIASGGTATGYMDVLRERRESDAENYNQARDMLNDFMREGGTEEVLAAHRALNDELEAAGIAPLPLPARIRRGLKVKGMEQ